jgi:glycosyltransferase involved in cell wall biosynthesis
VETAKWIYVRQRFKKIDYFLSVGDANEEYYKYYGVNDRKIIRNPFPIDKNAFELVYQKKTEANAFLRSKYGIEKDAIVFSVVGKFEVFKRQLNIIESLKIISCHKKIVLLVIGTGPNESALKKSANSVIRHKVIFTGFIAPGDLASFYAVTDIYIHPSEKEPHSLSISEAIYMGCPLLISDSCGSHGPSDDLQEGKNGFVFQTGNILELAGYINYLVDNDELIKSFGEYSRMIGVQNQYMAHSLGLKGLIEKIRLVKYLIH